MDRGYPFRRAVRARPALGVVLAMLCAAGPLAAQAILSNPVHGLREALRAPAHDLGARSRCLNDWADRIRGITELGHALVLDEWRDEDVDEPVAAVDREVRARLQREFEQAVRQSLEQGDPASHAAVADLLAGLGVSARAVGTNHSIGHLFTSDLARLARQGSPPARAAAARALGRINPDLDVALPALGALFQDLDADERIAAAEALLSLVQGIAQLTARSRNATGVQATLTDVGRVGQAVVRVAGQGLADNHPRVRQLCVAVMGQVAGTLRSLVPAERRVEGAEVLPPATILEWSAVTPLLQALGEQGAALTHLLDDANVEVRLQTCDSLREMGSLHMRLQQVPGPAHADDPLLDGLSAAVPALVRRLTDRDLRARLGALDVLETLGPAAALAAPALRQCLVDPDRFVRRQAARTLGKVGPPAANAAALPLARLLADDDPDLALTAAAALARLGPSAHEAVPLLVQRMRERSRPEVRVAAAQVLAEIGSPAADAAVPDLCVALTDTDERVRAMAAQTLGRLGPTAQLAIEGLRQARIDPSPAVQRAANDALLHLAPPSVIRDPGCIQVSAPSPEQNR